MSPLLEAAIGITIGVVGSTLGLYCLLLWFEKGRPEWFRGRP